MKFSIHSLFVAAGLAVSLKAKVNPMKTWTMTLLPLLLAGCATTKVSLSPVDEAIAGTGTLQIVWLLPNTAEILLDGKRYVGEWSGSRCFTSQCRGEFWNVPKLHRRHIRRSSAELVAKDNTRLHCEWVSHDEEVIGSCQADNGGKFKLEGKGR